MRHTFRLSRGASDTRRNLLIELEDGGLVGLGEAAPIARYAQENACALFVDVTNPNSGIMWVADQVDVTRQIVDAYDKAQPSAGAAKPAAAKPAATAAKPPAATPAKPPAAAPAK